MDKKKLETFKKKLEVRQQDLRRMVTRTQQDGRSADEDTAQDIADKAASSYNKEFLFHQSNADNDVLAPHNRGVVARRERCDDRGLACLSRGMSAALNVLHLVVGDDATYYRSLPVIIRGNLEEASR